MKNQSNTPAQAMAAQFKVTDLEPRMENAWAGGFDGPEVEHQNPDGWVEQAV